MLVDSLPCRVRRLHAYIASAVECNVGPGSGSSKACREFEQIPFGSTRGRGVGGCARPRHSAPSPAYPVEDGRERPFAGGGKEGAAPRPPHKRRAIAYRATQAVDSLPLKGGGLGWGSRCATRLTAGAFMQSRRVREFHRHQDGRRSSRSNLSRSSGSVSVADPHPDPPPFRGTERTTRGAAHAIVLPQAGEGVRGRAGIGGMFHILENSAQDCTNATGRDA
jgi:hypothetical protein